LGFDWPFSSLAIDWLFGVLGGLRPRDFGIHYSGQARRLIEQGVGSCQLGAVRAGLKKMSALVIMIIPFWICDKFGGNGRGRESDTQF
jgi:hypothetical protein